MWLPICCADWLEELCIILLTSIRGRSLRMEAALELVGARPAARALLLVQPRRARAGDAADRAVAGLVQRIGRNLVDGDVRPDALLVPVRERMDLPDAVALRPLHLRRPGPTRRLVAADPGHPRVVRLERLEERLHLANVAAAVGIALPEIGALPAMLLGHGDDLRPNQRQAVALDQALARLVALEEEQVRVQLDAVDVEPELGDHVHKHGRLLLPRAGEDELAAVLGVRPAEHVLGGHGLKIPIGPALPLQRGSRVQRADCGFVREWPARAHRGAPR